MFDQGQSVLLTFILQLKWEIVHARRRLLFWNHRWNTCQIQCRQSRRISGQVRDLPNVLYYQMHKLAMSRRIANGAGYGLSLAERGLATYNTIRAGYVAGSAIAAAASPYLVAGAAVL